MKLSSIGIALWLSVVALEQGKAFVPALSSSVRTTAFARHMFNGYHEPPIKPINVEAEEQKKKTEAAEKKVEMLRNQLQHKETEYQRLVNNLKDEMKKQESSLKAKVNDFANSLQNFKFDAHRKQLEVQEASKLREERLRKEVQALAFEKEQLHAELEEVKQKYVQDSMDWEDRLELEQDARTKLEREAQEEMMRLQEAARKQVAAAKVDATVKLSKKEKELLEKDYAVKETRWDMGNKEMKIRELEEERQSLRKLASISWDLTKSRVKGKLQGLKNVVTRNGKKKNGEQEPEEENQNNWDQSLP